MVLEDASSPTSPDSLADNPYPSDSDPYSTSISGPNIDWASMPRPIPLGRSYLQSHIQKLITEGFTPFSKRLGRPLTDEEGNAIAYHLSKGVAYRSYGSFFGGAAGGYRAYATRETWKFPFYQPGEGFDPGRLGALLQGQRARMLWQGFRMSSYVALGWFFGGLFMGSVGQSSAAVGMLRDERLKDLHETLRREKHGGSGGAPATEGGGMMSKIPGHGSARRTPVAMPPQQKERDNYDDMSPTSESYDWAGENRDTGVLSDGQTRSQESTQRTEARRAPTYSSRTTSDSRQSDFPGFDEDSPIGGAGPMGNTSSDGSSWDRIRRRAAVEESIARDIAPELAKSKKRNEKIQAVIEQAQEKEGSGATLGESFSFSKTDEERQLAKEEAQKEFDARVDRERGGSDFEDRGKRW